MLAGIAQSLALDVDVAIAAAADHCMRITQFQTSDLLLDMAEVRKPAMQ